VPEIASRMHIEAISNLYKEALKQADLTIDEIDAIAVTYAPGLVGSLLVGVSFAKGLSFATGKPLIPVHHLRSHIAANYITNPNLKPPFLALVISGGHTHLINVKDYCDYEVIGRTRDDAAGECFDKSARALGLPYPGGIHLDKLAENGDNLAYALPKPKVDTNPLDFSFSGLKTAVLNTINNSKQKGIEINVPDICASLRKTVTDILLDKISKAVELYHVDKLVLAGGVSANSEIRRRVQDYCNNNDILFFSPELKYCGDNAAMVGVQSLYEYNNGKIAQNNLNAFATMDIETLK
ncbi:MAG: tRNA (adenosine(37)-N6)-threonylcarbamoyltransferase complex transferase subunit TsaD, partial [Clostridia bacterium]|nr:tRNA (adenosine(37)-N6)-threonylcarbamoyltransferase complex transferase subunit TsaD [Clostridia bacterium]